VHAASRLHAKCTICCQNSMAILIWNTSQTEHVEALHVQKLKVFLFMVCLNLTTFQVETQTWCPWRSRKVNLLNIRPNSLRLWFVECSWHSRTITTVLCCCYTDTRRQLLALKWATWDQLVMQTWIARCVGEHVGYSYAFFADVLWAGLQHNRWGRFAAPVVWGSTLDTRTPSLRMCCEPACDAGSPLVELPVDSVFTCCECRCDCVWSLLAGAYLYTGGETAANQ
jgi:hypothetical protein